MNYKIIQYWIPVDNPGHFKMQFFFHLFNRPLNDNEFVLMCMLICGESW